MSSYVVAGASRGLGFEYVRQLSENPDNTVIALVRSVEAAKKKFAADINRPNVHVVYADFTRYETFTTAANETAKITDGKLDYLIGNAAIGGEHYDLPISAFGKNPDVLNKSLNEVFNTNAVSYIHLLNAFIPLILKGTAKKVIVMTTGLADPDLTREYDLWMGVNYSIAKTALNMIIAKFSAEYRPQGVLVLGISPGVVDTHDPNDEANASLSEGTKILGGKLMSYNPEWKGMLTPKESINMVLSVIHNARIDDGRAGDYVSHYGTKKWI